MMLVEIVLPCMPGSFDFFLEEELGVQQAVEQMWTILKDTYEVCGKAEDYWLVDADRGFVLAGDLTLSACGVRPGSRLLLL